MRLVTPAGWMLFYATPRNTTYESRMQCMQAAMWAGVDAHQQYTLNQERTARQWLLRWGDNANVGGSSNGAAGTYLPLPAL